MHQTKHTPSTVEKNLRKGFTLVEMLLVATLIGLLAAIATPKLGQLFEDQKRERAELDVSMLNQALSMWRADNPSTAFYEDGDFVGSPGDPSGVAAYYTSQGFTYAGTIAKNAEKAFSIIKPYVGQANNLDYLLQVIGGDVWDAHYYQFNTSSKQFEVGNALTN